LLVRHSLAQLVCRFDIELEPSSFLTNHHTIITPGRFERNITGLDIGKNRLWIAFYRFPEYASPDEFNQKPVTGNERNMTDGLACHNLRPAVCERR
jgi:hypothetical protein